MIDRRGFLVMGGLGAGGRWGLAGAARPAKRLAGLAEALAKLEKESGGRLGVAVLDTGSGEVAGRRMEERFAMCSTFKLLLCAAVLRRVDRGEERLERAVPVPVKPLVGHSPLTEPHAGRTMTMAELCFAAMTQSDNTAANLLLEAVGGPVGFTRFARLIGDEATRIDRMETMLNEARPGDARDTTTPLAMARSLQRVVLGEVLLRQSREQLTGWMVANTYGLTRLRVAVPAGWRAGDKTGSNGETTSNDIGVFWPVGRAPVVVTAYLTECPGEEAKREAVLAAVGRLVTSLPSSRG